jgi:hypothetical protein
MGVCDQPGKPNRPATRTTSHHVHERELLSTALDLTAYHVSLPTRPASRQTACGIGAEEGAAESRPQHAIPQRYEHGQPLARPRQGVALGCRCPRSQVEWRHRRKDNTVEARLSLQLRHRKQAPPPRRIRQDGMSFDDADGNQVVLLRAGEVKDQRKAALREVLRECVKAHQESPCRNAVVSKRPLQGEPGDATPGLAPSSGIVLLCTLQDVALADIEPIEAGEQGGDRGRTAGVL